MQYGTDTENYIKKIYSLTKYHDQNPCSYQAGQALELHRPLPRPWAPVCQPSLLLQKPPPPDLEVVTSWLFPIVLSLKCDLSTLQLGFVHFNMPLSLF